MADFETIQEDIMEKLMLLNVAQLGECCVQLSISVPPAKLGKKSAIRAFVINHITSEDLLADDNAQEILNTLNTTLDKMVGDSLNKQKKEEVDLKDDGMKALSSGTGSAVVETDEVKVDVAKSSDVKNMNAAPLMQQQQLQSQSLQQPQIGTSTTRVELSRFREWKVTQGTFGGEGHLDYCSLCYQIEDAKELGYNEREIISGMVKAMKDPLKKLIQGKKGLGLEGLLKSIRAYAKVKNSEEVMDEMKAYCQQPKQSEIDYLTAMCTFRDNILAMTRQEEHPLDPKRVEKNFRRALSVGIKKDTIRLMLASVFKDESLSDDDLMREVNDAVEADNANRKKTKGERSAASNNLNAECGNEDVAAIVVPTAESALLKAIQNLSGKMDGLSDKVNTLEGRVNSISGGSSGGNDGNNNSSYKFIKCAACEKSGGHCKHCTLCGELGHKRNVCSKAAGNG